jgi:hypothetical protein
VTIERNRFAKVGDGSLGAVQLIREQQSASFEDRRPLDRGEWHFEGAVKEIEEAIRITESIGKLKCPIESVTMLRVGFENPFEMLECFEGLVSALSVKSSETQTQLDDFFFRRIGQALFE